MEEALLSAAPTEARRRGSRLFRRPQDRPFPLPPFLEPGPTKAAVASIQMGPVAKIEGEVLWPRLGLSSSLSTKTMTMKMKALQPQQWRQSELQQRRQRSPFWRRHSGKMGAAFLWRV